MQGDFILRSLTNKDTSSKEGHFLSFQAGDDFGRGDAIPPTTLFPLLSPFTSIPCAEYIHPSPHLGLEEQTLESGGDCKTSHYVSFGQ